MTDPIRYGVNTDPDDAQAMVEDPDGSYVHLVDYRRVEAQLRLEREEAHRTRARLEELEEWRYGRTL